MKSTRTLFSILVLLISIMCLYLVITNYDTVTTYVNNIVRKYSKNYAVVPDYSLNHRVYLYKTVSETDNFEPHNIEDIKKIYYTVLNNGWNNFTFYCPVDYETCTEDVKVIANSQNNNYISIINNYVNPLNSYQKYNTMIVDDSKVTLSVEKLYTQGEIDKLNDYIDNYIKTSNIDTNNVTGKDIEKIHDYLLDNITYDKYYQKTDEITESNKATGALFKGTALCSGYSDTFSIFLDKLNIPNFKVNSEEHEWNVVYFNNEWSHIDLTWDDDEINKNNNRNFFMISTKELLEKDKEQHNFDESIYLEIK